MDQNCKGLVEFCVVTLVMLSCAASARAQEQFLAAEPVSPMAITAKPIERGVPGVTRWKVSLSALAAANLFDTATSWNKRELNPALAQSSGTFGWQSAALKMGLAGAVVGVEWLAMRHGTHPGLYRPLSVVNFCGAATAGSVAGYNLTVPRSHR